MPLETRTCSLCPRQMYALLAHPGWVVYFCECCDGDVGGTVADLRVNDLTGDTSA